MLRQWLPRLWLLSCVMSAGAYAARVTSSQEFACVNEIIVSGVVLAVEKLDPVRGTPWPDGMVPMFTNCRARVVVLSVLKDKGATIAAGETISVRYPCGMVLQGPASLVSVDSEGNALIVATGGMPCGSEGYRLASGDSVLLGLAAGAEALEPGPGGFTWPARHEEQIRELVCEECAPSN
jgi:hypothetical protein